MSAAHAVLDSGVTQITAYDMRGANDLIFGIERIVSFLRETCTLEPGDLILTGTPSGVGQAMDPPRFLASGDRVRIAIDTLGEIEHTIA